MAQSLAKVLVHIVFSTKDRRPFLQNVGVREEMHRYLGGICRAHQSPSLIIGGVEDHVHILCSLGRTITIADLIRELKRSSSKWIKSRSREYSEFRWQGGYGVFSVSQSRVDDVRDYIGNQAEHHKRVSFQDEFRALLRMHGIEWDEHYVWD